MNIKLILCGLCTLLSTQIYAASFDCHHAKLATEKHICKVPALNDADVKMATVYNIVIRALPMGGRDAERDLQRQWLNDRNRCGKNSQCIAKAYEHRQIHLDEIVENRILTQGPF